MKKNKLIKFLTESNKSFTLISILLGFFIGGLILWFSGFNPFQAYEIIFKGIFSKPSYISYTIIRSTPLILTGLSVAFAFRTGLFNIGAEGQFIVGSATAALAGYYIHLPAVLLIPLIILIAIFSSGLWGAIAGLLKSKYGIHEVISTIMLNWIALYLQNYLTRIKGFAKPNSEASKFIQDNANITFFDNWKHTDQGMAWLNNHHFFKEILRTPSNFGIFIAILCAVLVLIILNKTTLGYKLRAVGFNKEAARYGGINVEKYMIISMFISGSLAGLAGALHVMGVSHNITILSAMEGYGFDGIAVALIGNNTAFGAIWSGFLFGALKYGGTKIQPFMGAPSEIISIMIGTIVFFISMPNIIKISLNKIFLKKIKRGEDDK